MRRKNRGLNRKMVTAVAAGLLSLGVASPAFADYAEVGGGYWWYGTGGGKVWSDYLHYGVWHGSSVKGEWYDNSGCQAPGVMAEAEAPDRWYATDYSYWRHC